jgi:hypothetical protein
MKWIWYFICKYTLCYIVLWVKVVDPEVDWNALMHCPIIKLDFGSIKMLNDNPINWGLGNEYHETKLVCSLSSRRVFSPNYMYTVGDPRVDQPQMKGSLSLSPNYTVGICGRSTIGRGDGPIHNLLQRTTPSLDLQEDASLLPANPGVDHHSAHQV